MQHFTKHLQYSIRRFFSYLGKKKYQYWFAVSLAVIGNAILTVLIAYVNRILFQAVQYEDKVLFTRSCMISIVVLVLTAVYPFMRYYHIRIVRVMIYELKLKMFDHMTQFNQDYLDTHHSGDAIQRIGIEAENLKTAYFTQVYVLCNLCIGGITALINMLIYSIPMTCFSVICCVVTVYLSSVMNRKIKTMSAQIQKKQSQLTQKITNIISGFLVIRLFEGSGKIIEDFEEVNENVTLDELKRTRKLSALQMSTFVTGMIGSLGSVLFGAWMVYEGKTDFGIVMAVVSLQINVSQTMQRFGIMLAKFNSSLAQADRVYDFLEMNQVEEKHGCSCSTTETSDQEPPKRKSDISIEFQDVTFSYSNGKTVLRHFNMKVTEKQKVMVIGPSGKGKSTIIKILLGLYPYQEGKVLVHGVDIKDMTVSELRKNFTYVPQNSQLFEGSILDNIRAGKPDATDAEVRKAAQLSFADEFIEQLPDQYQTMLVMGGDNLSGGQRQRIALARAFLKDAPILLLDEVTSALDTESENMIIQAIDQMKQEKTILMITHRLQTSGKYDSLVQLD